MKRAKRKQRIKGIVAAAEALGVTRQHLYYVLTGKRESGPLLRRYIALIAAEERK